MNLKKKTKKTYNKNLNAFVKKRLIKQERWSAYFEAEKQCIGVSTTN